ncbi:hypothetical protein DdX_20872 [Ditylenchus destructor]|uniref:Uncharacterized protein n=1 Tax=Ditylenchus destructor TaxID=166010 RepID=A0AAD4MGK5_9BILA|nr:hypothetical protein DdX_20872 [Ditylenchus destructor]
MVESKDQKELQSLCLSFGTQKTTKINSPIVEQAKVGWDGKYKFDFEVPDKIEDNTEGTDNVGTQYTWGVAADSRIFEASATFYLLLADVHYLQTLSHQPVKLKVLKNTTKSIDIYADITGNPIVGLPQQGAGGAKGAAFNKAAVEGVKLGLVKLVDLKTREDLQNQYGITKQITAQPPPEEEPKQKRNPITRLRKALWDGTAKEEAPQKQKSETGVIPDDRKSIWNFWGLKKTQIHPITETEDQENAVEQQSQPLARSQNDEHPSQTSPPASKPDPKSANKSPERESATET